MPEEKGRIAAISWEGDSWRILKSWPKSVQWDFGNSLREMQEGRSARLKVRPMPSVGKGVFELKDADESAWYGMLYLARVGDVIYVLDCFVKDTAKTERKYLLRARTRLAEVRQRIQKEKSDGKRQD